MMRRPGRPQPPPRRVAAALQRRPLPTSRRCVPSRLPRAAAPPASAPWQPSPRRACPPSAARAAKRLQQGHLQVSPRAARATACRWPLPSSRRHPLASRCPTAALRPAARLAWPGVALSRPACLAHCRLRQSLRRRRPPRPTQRAAPRRSTCTARAPAKSAHSFKSGPRAALRKMLMRRARLSQPSRVNVMALSGMLHSSSSLLPAAAPSSAASRRVNAPLSAARASSSPTPLGASSCGRAMTQAGRARRVAGALREAIAPRGRDRRALQKKRATLQIERVTWQTADASARSGPLARLGHDARRARAGRRRGVACAPR